MDLLLRARLQLVGHDDAGAGIPAQERVVVSGRTDRLGLFEPGHRLAQIFVGLESRTWTTLPEQRLGPALRDDSGIIAPLIRVTELRQQVLSASHPHAITFAEAIRDAEQQDDQRLLLLGVNEQ